MKSKIVILSGVHSDEGGMNGVEGSHVVWQLIEPHEILRLHNSPAHDRSCALRSELLRSE